MTKMTEAQLVNFVEQSISHSAWQDGSEIQGNYASALDSYYMRKRPKHVEGRSSAASADVGDMVEAVTAQIMESYDFQTIATFPPRNAEDVDQARVESLACNSLLMNKNRGYTVIQEAVRNALLLRNGIIKVWADELIRVKTKRYKNLTDLELLQLTEPKGPNVEIEIVSSKDVGEDAVDASIRTTETFRQLRIASIDPTSFLFFEDWTSIDLTGAPMCGERYFLSESELRKRGHSRRTVNGLATASGDTRIGSLSRDRGETAPIFHDNGDRTTRMIEVIELYAFVDYDGDGIAELRRLLYAGGSGTGAGGTVLENDYWTRVPYACGTGFLQPQRWLGLSLFDKLRELELQKTEALRQFLDNMAFANNSEVIVVDGAVEIDDLKARRPGGINRVDDINAIRDLDVQVHGEESLQLLNYLDLVRSERGGASLDLQAAATQIAGATAFGIERQYSTKESLARLMTRTLSETLIRQTFLLIHDTLRREFPTDEVIEAGGQFVEFNPGGWTYRDELDVIAGQTRADRAERVQTLGSVLQQQVALHQAGFGDGILVDMDTFHDTLVDWTAAGGIPNARRHWIDPRSPASLEAQQTKQQTDAQQAAELQQLQQAAATAESQAAQTQAMGGLLQKQGELQHKYWKDTLDSEIDELRIQAQWGVGQHEPVAIDAQQATGAVRGATGGQ